MGEPAIAVDAAAVRIGRRTIWSGVSMRVQEGEFVALLGANGSGKSTLLKALLGALPAAAGQISVLGRPPGASSGAIGYLPQRRSFAQETRLRGSDIVRLGLDGDRWGLPLPFSWGRTASRGRAARRRVAEVIETVGATGYADRPIGELSGGEQQRLLIAQALVRRPGCCCWTSRWTASTWPTRDRSRRWSARSAAARAWRCCWSRTTSTRCWRISTGSSIWRAAMPWRDRSRRS